VFSVQRSEEDLYLLRSATFPPLMRICPTERCEPTLQGTRPLKAAERRTPNAERRTPNAER